MHLESLPVVVNMGETYVCAWYCRYMIIEYKNSCSRSSACRDMWRMWGAKQMKQFYLAMSVPLFWMFICFMYPILFSYLCKRGLDLHLNLNSHVVFLLFTLWFAESWHDVCSIHWPTSWKGPIVHRERPFLITFWGNNFWNILSPFNWRRSHARESKP